MKPEAVATGVVLDDLENQRIPLRHEQYLVESGVGCGARGGAQDRDASTRCAGE
jgi:hypothetical protein